MIIFGTLERVLARAVTDEAALLAARDEWNARAGVVHDDEPLYEERTAAFLDWFALDRRSAAGPTAVEQLLAELSPSLPDAAASASERVALTALSASHRSLFRVRDLFGAADGHGLVLDDLWGGAAFRARDRRVIAGVARGDLLDARLVTDVESPPDVLLARIVCVHPRDAEPAIRQIAAASHASGEPRDELLFRLLRLRVRCERYRHVAPLRVYEAGEPRGQ